MIFYSHNREVLYEYVKYRPRTCFVMTQLAKPLPEKCPEIREKLNEILTKNKMESIDANFDVTGRDFLGKIWKMIHSVPFGIAILTEKMKSSTIANIFYEVGVLNALGKESIIVKTPGFKIPSDLIRNEYIIFDESFEDNIQRFMDSIFELAEHYDTMAESLVSNPNPNLSIDYWRRAFMIDGNKQYIHKTKDLLSTTNEFDRQSKWFHDSFIKN